MSQTGTLRVDPLFKGLTRPTMFLGVSFPFVMLNGMTSLTYFIQTSDFFGLLIAMPAFHLFGYVICFKEPLFLELFFVCSQRCKKCRNRFYYGANSYDVF